MRESPSFEQACPRRRGGSRSSLLRIEANVLLAVGGVFGGHVAEEVKPVTQPPRIALTRTTTLDTALPRPEYDMEQIMHGLRDAQDVGEFMQSLPKEDEGGTDFWEFFRTYHNSPEELQENNWQGACNNYAEFSATWAFRHGAKPYLVSLSPKGVLPKFQDDWHQFAACKLPDGRYVIFDNRKMCITASLSGYIGEKYPDKELAPLVGNIIPWRQPGDSVLARFIEHASAEHVAEEDMEEADVPLRGEQPRPVGPLA